MVKRAKSDLKATQSKQKQTKKTPKHSVARDQLLTLFSLFLAFIDEVKFSSYYVLVSISNSLMEVKADDQMKLFFTFLVLEWTLGVKYSVFNLLSRVVSLSL